MKVDTETSSADRAVGSAMRIPEGNSGSPQKLRASIVSNIDNDPVKEVERRKLAQRTGLPISTLKNGSILNRIQREDKINSFNFEGYSTAFPKAATFLADEKNAAVGHDDAENLGAIESTLNFVGDAGRSIGSGLFWEGVGHRVWGALGWSAATISEHVTGPIDEGLYQLGGTRGQIDFFDDLANFSLKQSRASERINQGVMQETAGDRGFLGRNFMSGMNSLGATAPGLVASVVSKNPQYALTNAGVGTFGASAEEGLAEGLSPLAAGIFGAKDAAIEVGTELIPINKFIGDLEAGSGLLKTLGNQLVSEVPGELLATTLQNFNEWSTLNADKPFSTYLEALPQDLADTLVATISAVGVQTGTINLSTRALQKVNNKAVQAQNAEDAAVLIEQLTGLSNASQILERDPETFEKFIELANDNDDVSNVYLDTNSLAQSGLDLDTLAELSPSIAKQKDIALNTGGLLKIPVSEYATTLAKSEFAQPLLEDLKIDPSGMSRREAQEFMQNSSQELEQEIERELEDTFDASQKATSRQVVEENILEQLRSTNRFTESVNKPYAALVSNFYETVGARSGRSAQEAFEAFPLKVQSEGADSAVFNQEDLTKSVEDFQAQLLENEGVKTLSISSSGQDLKLNVLIVDKDQRKQGIGSKVMQELVDFADGKGMRVLLSPALQDDFQGTTSRKRLINFYKRFGFVENKGRNKDFSISEGMYRDPAEEVFNQPELSSELDAIFAELEAQETPESRQATDEALARIDADNLRAEQYEQQQQVLAERKIQELKNYRDSFKGRKKRAAFTRERLDRVIKEYSHSNHEETKAQIGFVDPLDFVLATAPLDRAREIETEAGFLDEEQLSAEVQTPFLIVENNEIIGHEGRHRMIAMARAGVRKAPVVVRDYGRGYDTPVDLIPKIKLKGQQFLEGGVAASGLEIENARGAVFYNADAIMEEGSTEDGEVLFYQQDATTDTPAFKEWAGTDNPVIEPDEVNGENFKEGEGPFVARAFHGTTHDFNEFDATRGEIGSQFGRVNYFTTSETDASANYAGEGPDLTNRIETRTERLEQELEERFEEEGRTEVLEALGFVSEAMAGLGDLNLTALEGLDDADAAQEAARQIARQELNGGEQRVLEVYVKMENPFVVGDNSQFIEFLDLEEADVLERAADNEGISVEELTENRDDYEDQIDEARWEMMDEENPLYEAIEEVALEYGLDAGEAFSSFAEVANEGMRSADFEEALRTNETFQYADDEHGNLIGFQIVADVIEALGYDSIILKNASERFSSMDIDPGTAHIHIFDANKTNIKSVDNQGTFNPDDGNIFKQQQRGSFNPETSTITLLEAADLSTFLHESGHFFLETMNKLAQEEGADQQITDDMTTLLKWFGVKDLADWNARSLDEQRDGHEKFARGFEAYLFEGKAPSTELNGVFSRFRSWLVNIYRDITNLDVELNDEIRRVFDRMLATDEAIAETEAVRGMQPMFTAQGEDDMFTDPVEWEAYQALGKEATALAKEQLDARSLRDMKWLGNARAKELKRLQRDAAAKRRKMKEEVTNEIMLEPVNQAHSFITKGEYIVPANANKKQRRLSTEIASGEGSTKMDLGVLEETYGKDDTIWQGLPKGKYGWVSKDGLDFNFIAELFGFSSGDQMLQMLLQREDPKTRIEALTDQRMLETYGDITDPASLEAAADAAVHNEARTKMVAAEASALQKAVGGNKILAKAAKDFATQMISRLRIRDVKPSRYTAAEARASKEANKARAKGDLETAAVQKRNQLIQMYAAKSALEVQEQVQKDLRYLKKFDKEGSRKKIDVEYLDQIDDILVRFDLKKATSLRELDKRKNLTEWLAEQEEVGIEPDIPEEIINSAYKKHYKDMSVEEMQGLVESIKQIEHLGRLKNKLLTLKDKRQFKQVVDEVSESIRANFTGKKPVDNTTRATKGFRAMSLFKGFLAEHRKIASLSRQMDGVKDGGAMWEVFIRTMNEAGDAEATMREKATIKMAEMSADIMKLGKMNGKGKFYPALGRSLNREERLAIVLNMGNESNMQRLLDGKGWTRDQVETVVQSLTASEAKFVQDVWDLFESYRPQISAKERRIYGKEPNWIEPTPLETPHGELRGGYYPVKYDTRQNAQAEQFEAAEVAKQQLKGAYTSSTTRRSFTKERADKVVDRPLLITMDALYGGLNEVIHDLAWHEWLIDANRLVRNKKLSKAVLDTQGADAFKQYKLAIEDIAAGEMAWTGSFEKVSAHLRAGATVAGLGLSISTALINVTGLGQSFVRVGTRNALEGVGRWAANPTTFVGEIYEKSEFMRLRGKTMQREINEIQSLLQDKPKWRQTVDTLSFAPIVVTQIAIDTPTWWGGYKKALTEGNSEERAIALADQAVIDSQGGGQVKDLASIQRTKVGKLFTVFYSYFSTTYQLTVEQTSKTNFKDPLDVMRLAGDYFLLYVLPAALGTIIRGAVSGDDDWNDPEVLAQNYINEQISFAFGTIVGMREIAGGVQKAAGTNQYFGGYSGPASMRFLAEMDKLGAQIGQGDLDKALIRSMVNVGGVTLRLPSSQTNRTIDGMIALMDGDTQNPAALAFGAPN